jgi:hypothetical protein
MTKCTDCQVKDHDICPLVEGCPCCDNTKLNSAIELDNQYSESETFHNNKNIEYLNNLTMEELGEHFMDTWTDGTIADCIDLILMFPTAKACALVAWASTELDKNERMSLFRVLNLKSEDDE